MYRDELFGGISDSSADNGEYQARQQRVEPIQLSDVETDNSQGFEDDHITGGDNFRRQDEVETPTLALNRGRTRGRSVGGSRGRGLRHEVQAGSRGRVIQLGSDRNVNVNRAANRTSASGFLFMN